MASTRYTGLIKKALKQKKKNKASFLSNLSCLMFDLPSFTKVNISRTLGCIPKTFDYLLPKGEYKVIMNPSDYNDIGVEFSLYSLISFLECNEDYLKAYKEKIIHIEQKVIAGDKEGCKALLDECNNIYGYTFWSIDTLLSLYYKIKSADDIMEYINSITTNETERNFLHILFYKHSSTGIDSFSKNHFNSLQREYKANDMSSYIDMISALTLPLDYDSERNFDGIIELSVVLSPLDRYLLLKKTFVDYTISGTESSNHSLYIRFFEDAYECTKDSFWLKIKRYHEGELDSVLSPCNESVIRLYNKGEYKRVIDDPMLSTSRDLSLLDIKAKSMIYTSDSDSDFESDSPTNNLEFTILTNLYFLHTDPSRYKSIVQGIENFHFKYYSIDTIKSLRPSVYSSNPHVNQGKYKNSCVESYLLGFNITPKHYETVVNKAAGYNAFFLSEISELSAGRKFRQDVYNRIAKNDYSISEVDGIITLLQSYKDITLPEIKNIICQLYIRKGRWDKVIALIAEDCLPDTHNVILYPLEEAISEITSFDGQMNNIESTICLYLHYLMTGKKNKILVSEALEDYLESKNVTKPSQLFDVEYIDINNKLAYHFFFDVCRTDIMIDLISFGSEKELFMERLKIIRRLITKNQNELLQIEEKEIINKILSRSLTNKHNSNKLSIDVEGIKKSQLNEYRIRFENLLMMREMDSYHLKQITDSSESGGDENDEANYKFTAYESLYQKVISDFIVDSNFGLARSLSSEIRHGVLPNKLRSVFESSHLITVVDLNSEYEDNIYWNEINKPVYSQETIRYIDAQLKEFSKNVDELITIANSWPTISEDYNDKGSIFNFAMTNDRLSDLTNYLDDKLDNTEISNPESLKDIEVITLLSYLEQYIWTVLEVKFSEIIERFNHALKPRFNDVINKAKLSISSGGVRPIKLLDALTASYALVVEEITEIETWFTKPNLELEGAYCLEDIISSSIDCIYGIYSPKKINIQTNFSNNNFSNSYSIPEALGIVRALISIYQNCLSHGDKGRDTVIDVNVDGRKVEVYNRLKTFNAKRLSDKGIVDRVNSFSRKSNGDKLVNEGNTGLYKIYRSLLDSSEDFAFCIDIDEDGFYQKVSL